MRRAFFLFQNNMDVAILKEMYGTYYTPLRILTYLIMYTIREKNTIFPCVTNCTYALKIKWIKNHKKENRIYEIVDHLHLTARELNNGQVTAEMNIKYIFKQIKTQHN